MYSVYFNNILQDEIDIINILDDTTISLIREDGLNSAEHILREKSETVITFTGKSYQYICSILKEDSCAIVDVKLINDCDLVFSGTMNVSTMERTFGGGKCFCKSTLKDNSFSGYIRDYTSTDVSLFNTNTKNCNPIKTIGQQYIMPSDAVVPATKLNIQAFDVLDVFKYMIHYYTDNKFEVQSTFLTTNKYAITTGWNMHNHGLGVDQLFPTLSFQTLFDELRKKLRIYMGIQYDIYGNPYLRIENEGYFFQNIELFSIDDYPKDTVQTYDNARNFNQIEIGSDTTKTADAITYYQNRYTAWNKESYGGCGTCIGEKEIKLDLVSKFVIDSNIIFEALNFDTSTDYDNDDKIFLFNYELSGTLPNGKITSGGLPNDWFYNEALINQNVLSNYIDYFQKCIEIQRQGKYGFLANKQGYEFVIPNNSVCFSTPTEFNQIIYDNQSSLSVDTKLFWTENACIPLDTNPNFTVFTCVEAGSYNFQYKIVNLLDYEATFLDADWDIHIVVFTDNTYASVVTDISENLHITQNGMPQTINLLVQTGDISLGIGNTVVAYVVRTQTINIPSFAVLPADYASFELLSDSFSCESATNIEDSKPYNTKFSYPLCIEDFKKIQAEKRGYINVNGYKMWLKELKYNHKKMSSFTLIGNDLIC